MLFTIVGDDFKQKSKKTKEIIAGLTLKKPDAVFVHYDFLDLDQKKFSESLETVGGLFEEKNIFWFSNIFRDKKLKALFFENKEKIASSENAFILTEDEMSEIDFKKIQTISFLAEKYSLTKRPFDIFNLSNLLQQKDKKNLWIAYHSALQSGIMAEQIYANLLFSLKTLALTENFSEKESGLKSFPYKKAKAALSKWKTGEVKNKLFELISLHSQSRFSGLPLQEKLEKYILSL